MKPFVLRGLAAGAIAGVVAALFLRILTETQIGFALKFEDATGIGAAPGDAPEFTRPVQHLGGMLAAVLYASVLGLVLGVAVAALRHRIRGANDFERTAKVAAGAFLAVVLIPALKYPPNPPTVGDPDTIGQRTGAFLTLLVASILVTFAAWFLREELARRGIDGAKRFLLGGGAYVAMVVLLLVAWPANPDAINPPDSDAAPALEVSASAPPEVLAALLDNARAADDGWIRSTADPAEPLDLDTVTDGSDLVGAPAAVSTTKLVPHAYTSVVWNFRLLSIGGLALMWATMAGVLGLLLDRGSRDADQASRDLAGHR